MGFPLFNNFWLTTIKAATPTSRINPVPNPALAIWRRNRSPVKSTVMQAVKSPLSYKNENPPFASLEEPENVPYKMNLPRFLAFRGRSTAFVSKAPSFPPFTRNEPQKPPNRDTL